MTKYIHYFILLLKGIIFIIILILAAIGLLALIPITEALTEEEIVFFDSAGDCRIVNTIEAIKGNHDIYIYAWDNSEIKHFVAVTKNSIVIDIAKVKTLDPNKSQLVKVNGKKKRISIYNNKMLKIYEKNLIKGFYLMYKYNLDKPMFPETIDNFLYLTYIVIFKKTFLLKKRIES